jgi:rhamnogalacturonyl hydrolase YesR
MEGMKLAVTAQKETLKAIEILNDLKDDGFSEYETLASISCALVMESINQDFTKEKYLEAVEMTWDALLKNVKDNEHGDKPTH